MTPFCANNSPLITLLLTLKRFFSLAICGEEKEESPQKMLFGERETVRGAWRAEYHRFLSDGCQFGVTSSRLRPATEGAAHWPRRIGAV
ncbi:hypothetical protein CEXT_547921 [Caerostris extrusa]|uniref:Secreted protein n=1 Tax=Caerostris extrusa TaxID=172846 RepID=A0AAV4P2T0_CAEEX|nr:hypothetical protein CEXT_547921 [Caerostris extrusa]